MIFRRSFKVMMIMILAINTMNIYACFTTFINDNTGWVIIDDHTTGTLILVKKNEKRRFGSQHNHAHFSIYLQKSKTPVFSKIYTCKQNTCGATGNVKLKFSEVEKRQEATSLFTITEYEPHSSMVQELPMVQEHCRSCNNE